MKLTRAGPVTEAYNREMLVRLIAAAPNVPKRSKWSSRDVMSVTRDAEALLIMNETLGVGMTIPTTVSKLNEATDGEILRATAAAAARWRRGS